MDLGNVARLHCPGSYIVIIPVSRLGDINQPEHLYQVSNEMAPEQENGELTKVKLSKNDCGRTIMARAANIFQTYNKFFIFNANFIRIN